MEDLDFANEPWQRCPVLKPGHVRALGNQEVGTCCDTLLAEELGAEDIGVG